MFGRKMYPAPQGVAAEREAALLAETGLTPASFHGFGKLLGGARRMNVVYVADLAAAVEAEGVRLSFTLPAGSYATVLLREVCKSDDLEGEE
jgi:tRNA pseudouridine13 synthase